MATKGKTLSNRALVFQIASLVVAVVVGLFGFGGRIFHSDDAFAQVSPSGPPIGGGRAPASTIFTPASATPQASASASSSATVVVSAVAPPVDSAAPPASSSMSALDSAVAPDGGVPSHPSGTRYKSPFAKPDAGEPLEIRVGMLLNTVDDYDVKTGTFSADFFLSLTSKSPMPELDLQFPNGKLDQKTVVADKPTFKLYRLAGEFKSPADLRKYPFDSQELKILVEDDVLGVDQIRFVADPDHTKLARGFRAVGWQVSFVEAKSVAQSYPDRFDGDDLFYGRYVFSLGLDRFASSAAFTVYVPAMVIVLISLMGMWVPPREMEVRSNSGAPMLAGAVLFHFALIQELPATSYLTRADKLMLGVYISLILGMLSTWVMFLVSEENQTTVFKISRAFVPTASVVVMGLACLA